MLGCSIALVGEAAWSSCAGRGDGGTDARRDLLILSAALIVSLGYVAGALLGQAG